MVHEILMASYLLSRYGDWAKNKKANEKKSKKRSTGPMIIETIGSSNCMKTI